MFHRCKPRDTKFCLSNLLSVSRGDVTIRARLKEGRNSSSVIGVSECEHSEFTTMDEFEVDSSDEDGSYGMEDSEHEISPTMDDSGRLRLRADITLDGPDYAGRRSSRKQVLGDAFSTENDLDESGLEQLNLNSKLEALYSEGRSDEDEDDELSRKWQLNAGQDDELAALSREYEKLREQEVEVLQNLKVEQGDNHRKGQAVQHQKNLWDKCLEARISLQKILSVANRLPKTQAKATFCGDDINIKDAYSKLTESATLTLDCFLALERALIEQNSVVDELFASTKNASGKREALRDPNEETDLDVVDKTWEKMDQVYSRVVPFRDNALDRWQRKTQLNTGAVAKGRLRAFNQSISQQIVTTMRDTSRLVKGMRIKQSSIHILGEPFGNGADQLRSNGDSITSPAPNGTSVEVQEDEGDPETFDDSEFYQKLLHEFLELADPNMQGGMSLHSLKKLRNKTRKVVDRRASKGRKIRYNVLEPLLNFMAPSPLVVPPMTSKLFANLFGHQKPGLTLTS